MIKLLSCRFQQGLGPFKILSAQECPETGHFRHLSNGVIQFRKDMHYEAHLIFQNVQI